MLFLSWLLCLLSFIVGMAQTGTNVAQKENTERMGKWSNPWWRSFLTLHNLREFLSGGDAKISSMVVSQPFSEHVIDPWGSRRCKKWALKKEMKFSAMVSVVAWAPPHKG
jgi:hypothetical protein